MTHTKVKLAMMSIPETRGPKFIEIVQVDDQDGRHVHIW